MSKLKAPDFPINTFIPYDLGNRRFVYFEKTKIAAMNAKNPASAIYQFNLLDLWEFIGVVSVLTTESGINVHFGTNTKDEADFVLIFTSSGEKCLDFGDDYFQLGRDGSLNRIDQNTADQLRKNYQGGVREKLDKARKKTSNYTDTDYVHFDKNRINEILAEIKYYHKLKKISRISINIVSYTDNDRYSNGPDWIKSVYQDRLTIQFGYLNDANQPTSLQAIDPPRYEAMQREQLIRSGYDTGVPVPPPVGKPDI